MTQLLEICTLIIRRIWSFPNRFFNGFLQTFPAKFKAWLVIACHSFEQEEEISKRKILTEKNILNSEDQNLLF